MKTKLQMFLDGDWECKLPPVTTALWDNDDWIRWIDKTGKWTYEGEEK